MSRRQRALLVRTVLFLFGLNSVSLALYFFFHPRAVPSRENLSSTLTTSSLKPWPSLPSYLPWLPNRNPPLLSCEAYFGNGFSRRVDAFGASGARSGGWFRCFYSETLKSSICEGGRVRMDPRKIQMSQGGESLEFVMGRGEEEEMPRFEDGAFEIEGDVEKRSSSGGRAVDDEYLNLYVPRGLIQYHTMQELMRSMRIVASGELQCSQWIEEPTVLVTRFEYANLFHTTTDWYNAYVSCRVTSLPNRPHLIFVDGHCKAPLEETWEALFSTVKYAKNFSDGVCFRHLILSPLGYDMALFKGLSESIPCKGTSASNVKENLDNENTSRLSEFGEMLRAAFDLPVNENSLPVSSTTHNILFIRREDYLAHPRHKGKLQSRLSNEQEVFDSVRRWASTHTKCRLNLVNGLFAHMSMKEQLRAIYEASVIMGAHGAGLTHLVSARSNTIVLELISSQYQRPHFALISQWKGLQYHAMNLAGSYARPEAVLDELGGIMKSLGC